MHTFQLDTYTAQQLYGKKWLFFPPSQEAAVLVDGPSQKVVIPPPEVNIRQEVVPEPQSEQPPQPQIEALPAQLPPTPPSSPPQAPFTYGQQVDWKARKTAKLVLVVSEKELSNKFLMNGLRFFASDQGFVKEHINFGLFKQENEMLDLTDCPHAFVLIFGKIAVEENEKLWKTKDRIVYLFAPLLELSADTEGQERLVQTFKDIKNLL